MNIKKTSNFFEEIRFITLENLDGEDWDYEGLVPHVYVIEYHNKFYGFWNDKDDGDLFNFLFGVGPNWEARWIADSLDELIELIKFSFK